MNGGYQTLANCQPFEFIRSFSYPNWKLKCLWTENPEQFFQDLRKVLGGKLKFNEQIKDGIMSKEYLNSWVRSGVNIKPSAIENAQSTTEGIIEEITDTNVVNVQTANTNSVNGL